MWTVCPYDTHTLSHAHGVMPSRTSNWYQLTLGIKKETRRSPCCLLLSLPYPLNIATAMFSINITAINAAPIQIYTFITMLSSFHTAIFNRFIVLPRCYARPCALVS